MGISRPRSKGRRDVLLSGKVRLSGTQLGGTPPSAKPWKGLGSGVYELIEDHRGDTYRAVYTVRIADSIHVLHAFQKKSKSGIKTPKADVALIERRLKSLQEHYRKDDRNRSHGPQDEGPRHR